MNDVANKVATLMEAMPYLKKYAGKVIVIKYGGNVLRFIPPLIATEAEIDVVVKALDEAMTELGV